MSPTDQYELFAPANPPTWFETFCSQSAQPMATPVYGLLGRTLLADTDPEKGEVMGSPSLLPHTITNQLKPASSLERACRENRAIPGLRLPALQFEHLQLIGSRRMEMIDANFQRAQFAHCRLWVNLTGSQLGGLLMDRSNCQGSRLADCQLFQAAFRHTTLNSVSFCRSTLSRAHFTDCQLRQCDFSLSQLCQASFKGCDLTGSDFRQSDLTACDFRGADLRGTSFTLLALEKANLKPIRQRIQDLSRAYPMVITAWLEALRGGRWLASTFANLSSFLSTSLGYRVGAGWSNTYGSTEWIIWRFFQSIQPGESSATNPLASLLVNWLG